MKAHVYILTSQKNTVLYTGVTRDLKNRIHKHKTRAYPFSFTAKYNVDKLVWYEEHDSLLSAIRREKQIKGGSRKKKIDLITTINPEWEDLYFLI